MPTGQLRQSNNIYNMAFFCQTALPTQRVSKITAKNALFLRHLCNLLRAPIKKAQRKNLVKVTCQQDKP